MMRKWWQRGGTSPSCVIQENQGVFLIWYALVCNYPWSCFYDTIMLNIIPNGVNCRCDYFMYSIYWIIWSRESTSHSPRWRGRLQMSALSKDKKQWMHLNRCCQVSYQLIISALMWRSFLECVSQASESVVSPAMQASVKPGLRSSCCQSLPLSDWVSLLCSHFLALGWDNPPCRGLQSAGQPGKSLNYPFALKLQPNHNSPQSVRLRTPASLRLIVGLHFFSFSSFSFPPLRCENGEMKLNQKSEMGSRWWAS